jgi:YD repeat-containing protein
MPRAGTTQTRAFVYDNLGRLASATNPENGTVTYVYNTHSNTLQYKHDAKGQDTVYTYGSKNRVTMVQKYPNGKNNAEDPFQQVTYTWEVFLSARFHGCCLVSFRILDRSGDRGTGHSRERRDPPKAGPGEKRCTNPQAPSRQNCSRSIEAAGRIRGRYLWRVEMDYWPSTAESLNDLRERWKAYGWLWGPPILLNPVVIDIDTATKAAPCRAAM